MFVICELFAPIVCPMFTIFMPSYLHCLQYIAIFCSNFLALFAVSLRGRLSIWRFPPLVEVWFVRHLVAYWCNCVVVFSICDANISVLLFLLIVVVIVPPWLYPRAEFIEVCHIRGIFSHSWLASRLSLPRGLPYSWFYIWTDLAPSNISIVESNWLFLSL